MALRPGLLLAQQGRADLGQDRQLLGAPEAVEGTAAELAEVPLLVVAAEIGQDAKGLLEKHGLPSARRDTPCFTVLHENNAGKSTMHLAEVAPVSDAREAMQELRRMADRVCALILSSDLPAVDIEIEKAKVRERCLELYPDREQLYDMVYESRFQRLWDQFRGELEEL